MIPPGNLADILTNIRLTCAGWDHPPTFFEIATVLALTHFARERCEAVVLETGMGGRLDATNAVVPLVSVLTPIARDHGQWLGNSIAEIAAEKSGIIKPGVPVVSAQQLPEARRVVEARAWECGSPAIFVQSPYAGPIGLRGEHQTRNAALALAALKASPFDLGEASARRGLSQVSWPARFQEIGKDLIVDGAHNPHAAESLVETWKHTFGSTKATVIFGALADKDYSEMISTLSKIAGAFSFVPVASPRSADTKAFFPPAGSPHKTYRSLEEAIEAAKAQSSPILITGSLFLAGEALSLLLPEAFPCRDRALENLQ
jgi:dihydrofolate synthase/folylpolyglutamate synthase